LRHETVELLSDKVACFATRLVVDLPRAITVVLRMQRFSIEPASLEDVPLWRGKMLLPIAILRPTDASSPTIRDEGGDIVPPLTPAESKVLVRAGLVEWARSLLGIEAPSSLNEEVLEHLLEAESVSPASLVAELETKVSLTGNGDDRDALRQARVLANDRSYAGTAGAISRSEVVVVALPFDDEARRVLTYELVESMHPEAGSGDGDGAWATTDRRRSLGATWIWLDTPGAARAPCYRLEVAAPQRLGFVGGRFAAKRAHAADWESQTVDCSQRISLRVARDDALPHRVRVPHVEAELAHQPRSGLVQSAMYSSLFTVFVLFAGLIVVSFSDNNSVPAQPDAGVAFVVLAAGLAGPLLVERADHPLTVALERPSRYLLYTLFAATFAAAGGVALEAEGAWSLAVWSVSLAVSVGAVLLLVAQLRRLRQKWEGGS
jgi:hypothetical protein